MHPGNLSDPGIELASPAVAGRFFTAKPPGSFITQGLCSAKLEIFLLLSFLEQSLTAILLGRWATPGLTEYYSE